MNKKIEKIINSVKNINQVPTKPYFYSRLISKLEKVNRSEVFYLKYERPFLITMVIFLLAINFFFITRNNESTSINTYTMDVEEIYFESKKPDIINFTSNEE
ncbi:MAG: hypothetical protein VX706_03910 [Bacteroidota bacterium]|jgi:hypothetical protein|nr:hypothetical protein [Bacteroidota bacterium]|tara:strand:- start:274 stop:579 length:306 start_codon:yes stop_codon:yes gene_type:complete